MQTAHAWVKINELGDNAQIKHITPAEALVIRKQFGVKLQGQSKPTNPITHLDEQKDVDRSVDTEYNRLVKKYGDKLISTVFPGEAPQLPSTFSAAGFEVAEEGEEVGEKPKAGGPEAGKGTEVIPLTKLSKEETIDEESAKEVTARLRQAATIDEQNKKIAELTELVNKLAGRTGQQAAN